MGKITYTKSQERAIGYRGGNLLLSAAAGSGKTATLTARILRLLVEEDASLTEMLVVTYTRAAAAELRGRITAAILEAERAYTENSGEDLPKGVSRGRFFRWLTEAGRADISTIHSFLLKALRPYFPTLGLSPDMGVMDEGAAEVLKRSAMQDVIDDYFDRAAKATEQKASFFELADALGTSRDAGALDGVLIDMANSLVSAGRDEGCLYQYADVLDADGERGFFRSVYGEYIKETIRTMLNHYHQVFAHISEEFSLDGGKVAEKYGPALDHMRKTVRLALDAVERGEYSAVRDVVGGYTPVALGRLTAKEKTEASEYFKEVKDRFKKELETLAEDYFAAEEGELTLSMHRTARILRRLGDVLGSYYRAFSRRKRSQNALDYADLETYALKLFIDENGNSTDAAREVGERYKYIFVDEYQDTNHVQDDIFKAISGNSVRFMVGDIKQSIYRFRGAEPEVFSGYRDRWPVLREASAETEEEEFDPAQGRSVFMSENFRCDQPVVRFVNMVSGYMFPFGGIPYTEDDALIFGKGQGGTEPCEICLIEKPRRKKGEETTWNDDYNPEAEYVAERIAGMLGTVIPGMDRPLVPRDIAVITRSLKGTAEVYGEALMRRGIRVRMKSGVTPMSARSVRLVMCILNLVDNPLREIYAAGAMRSPVFGFTTDDIVLLKKFGGELPLYMSVTRAAAFGCPEEEFGYRVSGVEKDLIDSEVDEADFFAGLFPAEEGSEGEPGRGISLSDLVVEEETAPVLPRRPDYLTDELVEKCVRLARWVKRHKGAARSMKADKYIEFLYGELGLSALPEVFGSAAERMALNRLYESARTFESGRFGGLSGFLDYMNSNPGGESGEVGEENAVSVVSIHASKGLEYPVVFLVECGKERNRADEQKKLLFDTALGFGMTLPDEGGLVRCDTAVRCGIAEKKRIDGIHEEMRVLYVAMTRARNRLIVTAKTPDAEALLAEAEREREYVTAWSVRECGTYRDMIVRAAALHGAGDFYQTAVIPLEDIHVRGVDQVISSDPGEGSREVEITEEDQALFDAIRARFDYRYPLAFLSEIPSKLSVSALSEGYFDGIGEDEPFRLTLDGGLEGETVERPSDVPEDGQKEIPLPTFMTGIPEGTGAERGTATHLFMQFMNLSHLAEAGVDGELARLVRERYLSPGSAELVNRSHMNRFTESELFRRLRESPMVKREFRFNVRMAAEKFTKNEALSTKLREKGIKVTVQGVVDCVFRGEDGLVLVDYKTDAMTGAELRNPKLGEDKLRRRHRTQLGYYKEICERLFGEKIVETLLYSTVLGRCVEINPGEIAK